MTVVSYLTEKVNHNHRRLECDSALSYWCKNFLPKNPIIYVELLHEDVSKRPILIDRLTQKPDNLVIKKKKNRFWHWRFFFLCFVLGLSLFCKPFATFLDMVFINPHLVISNYAFAESRITATVLSISFMTSIRRRQLMTCLIHKISISWGWIQRNFSRKG